MKADRAEPLLGFGTILVISGVLAGSGLAILWLGWHTDINLWLAERAFDPLPMIFPWRDAWLADDFTSLWLIACAVFWLPHNPRTAAGVAAAGMAVGIAMGWMQQLRGAHFLTHTLWSVWVAVLVVSVTTVLTDACARRYTPHTTS